MIIRISGGKGGIESYLETGVKSGRSHSRDELDKRDILVGDMESLRATLQSFDKDNQYDKYLHITLSFKEKAINSDLLRSIALEFRDYVSVAYDRNDFMYYAEAHQPKIKQYVDRKGDVVERMPHVHVIIPKINLRTGKKENPLGLVNDNRAYIDAFQEHINHKYQFESPKDNRRDLTQKNEILSRYTKAFKEAQSRRSVVDSIKELVQTHSINSNEELVTLLSQHGTARIVVSRTQDNYVNFKSDAMKKGINLKEISFTDKGINSVNQQEVDLLMEKWVTRRSFEVRHALSANPETRSKYFKMSPEDRLEFLNTQHIKRTGKTITQHLQQEDIHHENPERSDRWYRTGMHNVSGLRESYRRRSQSGQRGRSRENLLWSDARSNMGRERKVDHQPLQFVQLAKSRGQLSQRLTDRSPLSSIPHMKNLGGDRTIDSEQLASLGIVVQPRYNEVGNQTLYVGHQAPSLHSLSHLSGLSQTNQQSKSQNKGVYQGHLRPSLLPLSKVDRLSNGIHWVEYKGIGRDMDLINQKPPHHWTRRINLIDASALLNHLSMTHGVKPGDYSITKNKQGYDRIVANGRHYSASDFLQKELHLSWNETKVLLSDSFIPKPLTLEKNRAIWQQFKNSEYHNPPVQKIVNDAKKEKKGIYEQYRFKKDPSASHLKSDIKRNVLKNARTMALAKHFEDLDKKIKDTKRLSTGERYLQYLRHQASQGNHDCLDELRRVTPWSSYPGKKDALLITGQDNKSAIFPISDYNIRMDGSIEYLSNDQSIITDNKREMLVHIRDEKTIELALKMAKARFGNSLVIENATDRDKQIIDSLQNKPLLKGVSITVSGKSSVSPLR